MGVTGIIGKPFVKGYVPWNKGLKGTHFSPNTEFKKGSKAWMNRKNRQTNNALVEWHKNGGIPHNKGRITSEKTKRKISMALQKVKKWNGFSQAKDKRERIKFRKIMQKFIFQRDNYKCQICESKKDLQVDHIQSWAEFKQLRFDPENCRTLCKSCHYKITYHREIPNPKIPWGHNLGRMVV